MKTENKKGENGVYLIDPWMALSKIQKIIEERKKILLLSWK